ncbi:MAG: hypothetical protein AB9869_11410 [Verrucomicrobiia bacterium]
MTAAQIRALAASLPDGSPCFDADRPSWPLDREGRRDARISFALARPDFGWVVASSFAEHGRLIPACVQNPAIRRANYHLLGYRDPGIGEALSLMHPNQGLRRIVLNGLLCARDVDLSGIGGQPSRRSVELFNARLSRLRDEVAALQVFELSKTVFPAGPKPIPQYWGRTRTLRLLSTHDTQNRKAWKIVVIL